MQVQFPVKSVKSLRCILSQVQTTEETQQLRIPEPMADVGRIIGCWGQVLLRSKEWRDGYIAVSGGTMVWVMYVAEGEENGPQVAQAWLPFQMKWELPQLECDGQIRVLPYLDSVDARSSSARKIIVRTSVSVQAEAYLEDSTEIFVPEDLPEMLCVQKRTYPMLLPRECSEKIFEMEEDLTIPQSAPPIAEILRFSFHPELIDQKVLSGKVVFRGSGLVHLLYRSPEGEVCTWDFEIPFAQYDQLAVDYEQDAKCRVLPVVTGLELDLRPDGQLHLKAGVCGQYLIYDITEIAVAEDAYVPHGEVTIQTQVLALPAVLEMKQQTLPVEETVAGAVSKIVDAVFYPSRVHYRNNTDGIQVDLPGTISLLYVDDHGILQEKHKRWQGPLPFSSAVDVQLRCDVVPSGIPKCSLSSGEAVVRTSLYADCITLAQSTIPMISSIQMEETPKADPERPSLILQRVGNHSLWDLAKENGSTVEKIRIANGLTDSVEADRILLIPVL